MPSGMPRSNFTPRRARAILQLSVPVLAAIGGVLLLSESVSLRLTLFAALILGGIGLAIFGRNFKFFQTER